MIKPDQIHHWTYIPGELTLPNHRPGNFVMYAYDHPLSVSTNSERERVLGVASRLIMLILHVLTRYSSTMPSQPLQLQPVHCQMSLSIALYVHPWHHVFGNITSLIIYG